MATSAEPHYLRAIVPSLPTEIATKVRSLCAQPANEQFLENFVRLLAGAKCSLDASAQIQEQWAEKQAATSAVLLGLNPPTPDKKRSRNSDDAMDVADDSVNPKRQKTTINGGTLPTGSSSTNQSGPGKLGAPLFTLHSISTTSPVRKKVDITVHQNALVFVNPSTKAPEATVFLSNLKRAFVLPTRGKTKPHWTVILLSSDIPDNSKAKPIPGAAPSENQQVVFGLDANTASNFTTSSYNNGEPTQEIHSKNAPTIPHIDALLSHLNIPVIKPSASTFKSACGGVLTGSSASPDGIPGVEAYRAAKAGNLWFSKEGILWGESKPCEFWAVEDLISEDDGVRLVGAGRSCTVILTRRIGGAGFTSEEGVDGEDEEMGEEIEFGMIDGKEREPISAWVRSHRHSFGGSAGKGKGKGKATAKPKPVNNGPLTIHNIPDESDDDDEAFEVENASDLDGSERSSDDDSSANGSGSDQEAGSDDDGDGSGNAEDDDDEVEELDPAHHPLLRPGAMPRMSRAALNMAAAIVEKAVTGGSTGDRGDEQEEPEEEDELDD